MEKKSISRIFFSKLFGLIIFLILLAIANYLIPHIPGTIYKSIIDFFNLNLLFLIVISVIFLIGELFDAFIFPFNLPAPLFNALGGLLVAVFIFRLLDLLDILIRTQVFQALEPVKYLVYFIVIIAVILSGYIKIFARLFCPAHASVSSDEQKKPSRQKQDKDSNKISWNDIGDEFKQAFYNLVSAFKRAFENPKKKKK